LHYKRHLKYHKHYQTLFEQSQKIRNTPNSLIEKDFGLSEDLQLARKPNRIQ